MTPPPPARRIGPHVPGRPSTVDRHRSDESTTEVQQALSVDGVPTIVSVSSGGVAEEAPEEPTAAPSHGEHQEFLLGVDGSGGDDVWAVGLLDWRKPQEMSIGGRNINLGALRAMGDRMHYCDGHIVEAIGLYCALSYARSLPVKGTGGGLIVCDRMALLGNLAGTRIADPVNQMGVNLVKHSMWKLLSVHRYVTFVYKGLYGYGDRWRPDTLARRARHNKAWNSGTQIHVPFPLETGELRFVSPVWRPSRTNPHELLLRVTVMRA